MVAGHHLLPSLTKDAQNFHMTKEEYLSGSVHRLVKDPEA
jgi:hypothetical protein